MFAAYLPQSLLHVKLFLNPFDFISPCSSHRLLVAESESMHSAQRTFLSGFDTDERETIACCSLCRYS